MRRRSEALAEIGLWAAPAIRVFEFLGQGLHWFILLLACLYLLSGISLIRADEVALVLRWGRLQGETPAQREHGPGLLLAWPRPIERIVRIPVRKVFELEIETLTAGGQTGWGGLHPVRQGYALTGDQNIVHVRMVVRYRIRDAEKWAFEGAPPESLLRAEVTAAMVRTLGELGIDSVLSEGRQALVDQVTTRAQDRLDGSGAGIEVASLELTQLSPPMALASEFEAVQSAFIQAETRRKESLAYAERVVPAARGEGDAAMQSARADAADALALARGKASAFAALAREQVASPQVVRERLYRETLERALRRAGSVRWLPPPAGGSYRGFRITLDRRGLELSSPRTSGDPQP